MSLLEEVTKLVDDFLPLVDPEKIGEEKAQALAGQIEKVQAELDKPAILGEIERKVVTSFDEWDERIYGVAEFVRPDNTIAQFKIQSLTTNEHRKIRQRMLKAMPTSPTPRSRGDKIDPDDPHYKKDIIQYDADVVVVHEMNVMWILEKGLVDIEIPGKDDKEKMEFLNNKVAGDATKIAQEIMDLSNLTPENLSPFSRG